MNQVKSAVPGIVFPAITNAHSSRQLAIQFQFEQQQWWSASELLTFQFAQLKQLLIHASNQSDFYQERFNRHGLGQDWLEKLSPESFLKLPPLTRAQLRDSIRRINAKHLPEGHGSLSELKTSGSTGSPVMVNSTAITRSIWEAFSVREHLWAKRDFSKRMAVIRSLSGSKDPGSDGVVASGWGAAVGSIFYSADICVLASATEIEKQFKWLIMHPTAYLISHPSNLMALAETALQQTKHKIRFKEIRAVGEPVSSALREATRRAFSCEIVDMYSSQEAGYLALQCPDEPSNYHVMSEGIYLEVVNDDLQPVKEGEEGKVLVTNLNNFATPLIRYELGDRAILGAQCACGRGLPVLTKILGRERNMMVLQDGSKIWPSLVGFRKIDEVVLLKQFQVIQHSVDSIEVKLVLQQQDISQDQKKRVMQILKDTLKYPFSIKMTLCGEIARSKSGKYEDFMSLL